MKPKHWNLEDLTPERMLAAKAVRASDGCISRLLWGNPIAGPIEDFFVRVHEVTDEEVAVVKLWVCCLLLGCQEEHDSLASTTPARVVRAGASS